MKEQEHIAARRGKWSVAGVPHRGWHCVDIEDLGSPSDTCEMCESKSIRYVHHMEHPDYPGTLKTGCVCAGHMEGDLTGARTREASMRNRASKRMRWTSRKWKYSGKGNSYIKADGHRVTVYVKGAGFGVVVSQDATTYQKHSNRVFKSESEAKLAAFDHITKRLIKAGAL